jgi:GTP cyclohydrolase I
MTRARRREAPPAPGVDRARAEQAIADFLDALGVDRSDPHLASTPARVVSAWTDVLIEGTHRDPVEALGETFPAPSRGAVVVRDIPLLSMCPHHLLPLTGHAHVAFYPGARVPGFGRLATFVDALAHRLVLQEALTAGVAEALQRALAPVATAVVIEARHLCVAVTDPGRQGTLFRTTATTGPEAKAEALVRQIDAGRSTPELRPRRAAARPRR